VDGTTAAAQRNPTTRLTQVLVVTALVLAGYAIAHWLTPASPADVAVPPYPPVSRPMLPGQAVAALLVAGICLVAAMALRTSGRRRALADTQDAVSGLFCPRHAAEVLPGLLERDDRTGRSRLALVQIEIDFIEDLRERYSKDATDGVLGAIGRHILSQTRGVDLPTMDGGRAFAVYLRCTEVEQAGAFCRRLATLLRSDQFEWGGEVIKLSASMGVALRQIGEPLDEFQDRARQKLAEAKTAGGGRIAL